MIKEIAISRRNGRLYEGIDQFNRPFRSCTIILTSTYLPLLAQLIEVGKQPYHFFQWTLCDDLDIPTLIQRIDDKTGKEPSHITQVREGLPY